MKRSGIVTLFIAIATTAASLAQDTVRQRADDLLVKMTVEEKVGQLNQASGIVMPLLSPEPPDETIRKGLVGSVLWLTDPKEINRLQHIAVEQSRLHIPLLIGFDVIHGYRTVFPVPLAMASSWDPSVEEQAQHVAAEDARTAGINWTFAPMVDIARDARWGRIVEGAGEDPYLGSAMAQAQVRGFQGTDLSSSSSVLACVKHFAGYGAAEGGRDYDSSYIPEELLRNVYLLPFHAAVEAGSASLMSAYMDLNDVPATGNRFLLHDILRQEWGFQGFVVSDAIAVGNLVTHGFARDREDAAYRALTAGVNMDMASGTFIENVGKLVAEKKVTETQLDDAVRPLLEAKIRLGLFEHPYIDESKVDATLNRPESLALERKLAARSMVLLRNERHVLPLAKSIKNIAVVGPLADNADDIEGGWTVEGLFGTRKSHPVSVLAGIRNKLGASAQITYAPGPQIRRDIPSFIDVLLHKKEPDPQTPEQGTTAIQQAVAAARKADVVIAVVGEHANMSGEGASRATLTLPGRQQEMLEALVATGKPVVVVLVGGRPLDISWANQHVSGILEAWYPGTEGGDAVADVLFGDVNPGGKLPVTWPRATGQVPIYYAHNLTHQPEGSEGFTSRYWDLLTSPLYPFGYGLSYSTFKFSDLRLNTSMIKSGDTVDATVTVTNTGTISGDAVAQLYIHQHAGSASRPVRQLKGFKRITLAPGESQTLHFPLGKNELSFWSPQEKAWVLEPGKFDVWAGGDVTAPLHADLTVETER